MADMLVKLYNIPYSHDIEENLLKSGIRIKKALSPVILRPEKRNLSVSHVMRRQLKKINLTWRDIGFQRKGFVSGILKGLLLGSVCFAVSFGLELAIFIAAFLFGIWHIAKEAIEYGTCKTDTRKYGKGAHLLRDFQ